MVFEDIREPVEVITLFRNGIMQPLKFRWNNRVYKIDRVHGKWVSDEGLNKFFHYSVSAGSPDCFELCFSSGKLSWELTRVCMEG